MKSIYKVTYYVGNGIWSANIALAPDAESVRAAYAAEYSDAEIIVSPAETRALEEARQRGMPIVSIKG